MEAIRGEPSLVMVRHLACVLTHGFLGPAHEVGPTVANLPAHFHVRRPVARQPQLGQPALRQPKEVSGFDRLEETTVVVFRHSEFLRRFAGVDIRAVQRGIISKFRQGFLNWTSNFVAICAAC